MASRLLGILKARIIGSIFGASGIADVINFTFNIPNNFRKIFAEGALNGALIPYFSELIESGEKKKANRLMALLCTYQIIFFIPLCVLSYFFAEPLIAFFSDFGADKVALGARLLPFFMVFLATISIGSTFNGLLFCHKSFFHASFAPLLFSLSVILGIQFFHESLGAMSMAYATVIGGGLQGLYSYFAVRRYGYRLKAAVQPKGTPFKPLMKAWLQVMVGSSFLVIGQMVAYWFASGLDVGSVTAFSNSTIFWQTPYGIFFNAITSVSFPLMSRAWALGNKKEVQKQASKGFQYLATFLFPSFLLLYFLSNECVSAVLQTGNYTLADSLLTANVLRYYLLGMVIVAWYGLLQRLGYSVNRHHQITIVSLIQTGIDILCMWVLLHYGFGIIALPIANAVSFLIGLGIQIFILKDVYQITKDRQLAKGLGKLVLANLPLLGLGIFYSHLHLTWYQSGSNTKTFLIVCLLGIIGVGVTILSYTIFKIPFLQVLFSRKKLTENAKK
jgi:putative peptidoglycan lipid II flippase